jgi:SAM-dependent methyltransferase
MFADFDAYRESYEQLTGRRFYEARVLEIGYGARPFRLLALISMGIDIVGIDLDVPMLSFNPTDLFRILRTNGPERALKTAVRGLLFDRGEQANLRAALASRGHRLNLERARFIVGDAAAYDYGSGMFDIIFSDDVFEHVPPEDLEKLAYRLASILSPSGVALITPNVFPGICGGHLVEWNPDRVDDRKQKRSEPWEHLRKARFAADPYLNRLPRSAYRDLFTKHFEIVREVVLRPHLGSHHFTPDVRQELAAWNEEELFSNQVRFVLRPLADKFPGR